jgi:hypothetical protein
LKNKRHGRHGRSASHFVISRSPVQSRRVAVGRVLRLATRPPHVGGRKALGTDIGTRLAPKRTRPSRTRTDLKRTEWTP